MKGLRRTQTAHTDWCARDHRCGVTEHRSPGLIADEVGGRATLTRVRAGDVEYAEVYVRIPLHSTSTGAQWQIATTLRLLRELLAAVAVRSGVVQSRPARPALRGGIR